MACGPTSIWHRWWKTRNTLIAPNSLPVDQPWREIISRRRQEVGRSGQLNGRWWMRRLPHNDGIQATLRHNEGRVNTSGIASIKVRCPQPEQQVVPLLFIG